VDNIILSKYVTYVTIPESQNATSEADGVHCSPNSSTCIVLYFVSKTKE